MFNKNYLDLLIRKIILIILLQNLKSVKTEFYSSVHEMSRLVEFEQKFLEHMQNFIQTNEDKLEYLKTQLIDIERERDEALSFGPTYFNMPVNQYMLTKHLTVDWERIKNLMEYKTAEKSLKRISRILHHHEFDLENELNGGIAGLLRLQEAYRLKTKDIAAGILQGVQYDIELEASHCFDIGVQAIELKKFRLAHSWLAEAMQRIPNNSDKLDSNEPLDKAYIMVALAEVKTKLGDIKGANATYQELLVLKPDSEVLADAYMNFNFDNEDKESIVIDYSEDYEPLPADLWKAQRHERYKLTCSGHIRKTPKEERHLRCGYLTETHPFLQLAPIKVEELNHDPLLVQYYDVLSDNEIEIMKKIVEHRVERATVMSNNGSIVSPVRTSQFLFLPKTEHKVLQTIDQRVQDMTNLNMDMAEHHQFQNYGIGGHYAEHHDYFSENSVKRHSLEARRKQGDRIATVLFYLTDVEQGGGTAFPFLKQLLMPKKGAAAFWYNLHASGAPDGRTLHGGCPIIVGSKWVLNRWIRERNQDKTRPCEIYNDIVPGVYW